MQSTTKSFNGVVFSDSEEEIEDIQIVKDHKMTKEGIFFITIKQLNKRSLRH